MVDTEDIPQRHTDVGYLKRHCKIHYSAQISKRFDFNSAKYYY